MTGAPSLEPPPVDARGGSARYRCSSCGNLTRFDVTTTRRTRAFHHYSVGGELHVEDEAVLEERVEAVECRWCGTGSGVVVLAADTATDSTAGPPDKGATS